MKKKKKSGAFDRFYNIWFIVTMILLVGCILWYIFVERRMV